MRVSTTVSDIGRKEPIAVILNFGLRQEVAPAPACSGGYGVGSHFCPSIVTVTIDSPGVTMNDLLQIGTLWIGRELPEIEQICIASMVAQGHDVTLYAYNNIEVPSGVKVADASKIIPRNDVFTYKKTGSYATFADWFRLRMIAQTGKVWLDADAALLRPFRPEESYYFVGGDHRSFGRSVNNYVLMAPCDSAFIRDALSYFDKPSKFLKYMAWHRSLRLAVSRAISGGWNLSQFRWGVFGMGFLTDLVRQHSLEDYIYFGGPEIVEGIENMKRPMSTEVTIAHFFASGTDRASFTSEVPPPGSVLDHLIKLYGN